MPIAASTDRHGPERRVRPAERAHDHGEVAAHDCCERNGAGFFLRAPACKAHVHRRRPRWRPRPRRGRGSRPSMRAPKSRAAGSRGGRPSRLSSGSASNTIEQAGSMMNSRNTMWTGQRSAASRTASGSSASPAIGTCTADDVAPSPCAGCRRSAGPAARPHDGARSRRRAAPAPRPRARRRCRARPWRCRCARPSAPARR